MQNKRALLISLVVALFAVMIVFSYIRKKEKALMQWATPVKVVFAVKNIPEGSTLDETMLEEKEVPKKYVQPGAIEKISDVIDRVVFIPVLDGTQILESALMTQEKVGISAKISKGMRAFSIAVSDVTAVSGLIQPGDFVDIMATIEIGSYKDGRNVSEEIVTKTILQHVMVLAVNQMSSRTQIKQSTRGAQEAAGNVFSGQSSSSGKRDKITTLTLALTPEDTQKLNMAQEIGSLSASLRSAWETEDSTIIPQLSSQKFLGIKKPIVRRSQPAWVEIRGAEEISRY